MVYVLTEAGKKKVNDKLSKGCNCSEIARQARLDRATVSKIIDGKGVRIRCLEDFFNSFDLKLEETDYEEFKNNENTTTINSGDSQQSQNTNPPLNPEAPKYVKRSLIEQQIYKSLLLPSSILRIKAPKKMGKTILINQALEQLKAKEKYQTAFISLREADNKHLSELNEFLSWLCANVSLQLELPIELDDWDKSTKFSGSKTTCTNYFEKHLLQKLKTPLVLCLDNLELLCLNENICQDFLGMLRSWNDKASRNSLWQKLRLVISYAPHTEIKMNPNQSPFNIGTAIELPEFSPEQVQQFAAIYQLNWNNFQVRELMNMVGGHPYLLELTFRSLQTCSHITLEKILETAPTENGIYHNPHLQEYLGILKQHSDLAKVFMSIVKGKYLGNRESHTIKTLINLGLVKYEDGKILVRCELYRLYFESYLGDVE